MSPKKIRLWLLASLILVIYTGTILSYFWIEKNRYSDFAKVNGFSFCDASNQHKKIDSIEEAMLKQMGGVSLCGYLTTDNHPIPIDIYVFYESQKTPVYLSPIGGVYNPGFFEEFIPANLFSRTGVYYAKVYHGRKVIAAAELQINKKP